MVDSLGARDGTILVDRVGGGGITGTFRVDLSVIFPGDPEGVGRTLADRAQQLGYERDARNLLGRDDEETFRFYRPVMLPELFFKLVPPGAALDGIVVPAASSGVMVSVNAGMTLTSEQGLRLKLPTPRTRAYLTDLGIDFEPPPGWQRFWYWWWARLAVQAHLARTARRLGAHRRGALTAWLVGGELVGPYTFGVAGMYKGTRQEVIKDVVKRASRAGYLPLPATSQAHDPTFSGQPGRPALHLTTYGPGAAIFPGGRTVPIGFTGMIMSLTQRAR
ncbi:hypothetical protein [Streptacidiphilus sp. P02-A3a]|uniref:hypothetical protein n=1 Tax=Streptacidiphilus sp. P02-A3a TaxID=2704468 RepID=UPI0015F9DBED|nr:hypothetical protein [Streptacidiphilus sp. P02-A3a]QMU67590.1 hypothetical protein GXP74_04460 [Streptacidiphilus sp. P02-A3a]